MFRTMAAAMLALGLTGGAQASTIVQNGSFEDPVLTGGWDILTIPGWSNSSGGVEVQQSGIVATAYDGNQIVEMDGNTNYSIWQDVMLDVGSYLFSFAYYPRESNPGTNGVDFALGGLFSGSITGSSSALPPGGWTLVTQAFTVTTAGSYTLTFTGTGVSDSLGGLIDAVSIVPTVPVPAGGLLLLSALGGVAALRRRRG